MKHNLLTETLKQIGLALVVVIPNILIFGILPVFIMDSDTAVGEWIEDNRQLFFTVMTFAIVIFATIELLMIENRLQKRSK